MRLIIVMALLLRVAFCSAQSKDKINWLSFEEAMDKSVLVPKKVFIDVYTSWCGWCKKMDASTFSDSAIAEYINRNFYAVKLDAETTDTINYLGNSYFFQSELKANELAAYLLIGQLSYPTTVFLDERQQLIAPVPGYFNKDQFLPILKYFVDDIFRTKDLETFLEETFD